MKVYILIMRVGEDSGRIVQHAKSKKQARALIEKVMPKLENGYFYRIIKL